MVQLSELVKSRFIELFGDPVSNPKDWNVEPLGNRCGIITGNTPPRSEPENYGKYIEWIKSDNINTPYILKSPVRRIHKIRSNQTVKETYTDEALETMRDQCGCLRDLAMIDLLASTGMRVGELVHLNRDDIDFENRECVVFGKGSKERPVYFDARTKIHLRNYLDSRTDENPALFVSLHSPYNRLEISGVEVRLRKLGRRLGITKVHPHKFRRTLATRAIDKG